MTRLVFIDTETTGLSLDDDIWEFAAIIRENGADREHHFFIEHDLKKAAQLPESFRADHDTRYDKDRAVSQAWAAQKIADLTGDRAHIVGAVPNFDTERLAILLRQFGIEPGWHYHLIDVEALAVGYLHALRREYPGSLATDFLARGLPWNSDDLSRACYVQPPEKDRHTALGDTRWARDLYDAITGGA